MSVEAEPKLPRYLMPKEVPNIPPTQAEQTRLKALEREITSQRPQTATGMIEKANELKPPSTQLEQDDPSLDQLAELLVSLKVRPYRDLDGKLREKLPSDFKTDMSIIIWLHDWAEQQLKHETSQGIAYKDYQDGTRDGV